MYVINPLYILGNIIIVSIMLISLYFFRKGYKSTSKLFLIVIGLSIFILLLSQALIGSAKELSVLIFCAVYIFLPLFLLMYAARDVQDNPPIQKSNELRIKKKSQLNKVIVISIFMALGLILYSYFVIQFAKTLALQFAILGVDINETTKSLIIIGYIYIVLFIVLLLNLIGLFFRINFCRYIVIAICSYLFIIAFPFAIALFLCEKDIKALFNRKAEE